MIVSHAKKFIFVKTRKTSGTSMEVSLSQVCGPDDIITPISFEDELVRLDMGGTLPQNYAGLGEQRYRDMIKARKMKFLRARRRGKFFNHMPAVAIREYVGKKLTMITSLFRSKGIRTKRLYHISIIMRAEKRTGVLTRSLSVF